MGNDTLKCLYSESLILPDRLPVILQWVNGVCYVSLALVLLFANTLVIISFKKRQYSDRNISDNDGRKSFKLLMTNLSVAGLLLIIFLIATPGYAIPYSYYNYPNSFFSDIFCRFIDSEYCIHVLCYTSLMIATTISFKRWLAVARPHIFQVLVKKLKFHIAMAVIWLVEPLLCIEFVLGDIFVKIAYPPCRWKYVVCNNVLADSSLFSILEFLRFYFPVILIVLFNIDTVRRIQTFQIRKDPEMNRSDTRLFKKVVATAITAWVMVALCLPNQIYFTLSVFSVIRPYRLSIHNITKIFFVAGSSCAPFIYSLIRCEFKLKVKKKCQNLRCNGNCQNTNRRRRVSFRA